MKRKLKLKQIHNILKINCKRIFLLECQNGDGHFSARNDRFREFDKMI